MQAGAMTQARRRDHTGTQRTAFEEHLVGGEAPAALSWLSPYSRVPRLNQNSHSHRCELWSVVCARELWARQPGTHLKVLSRLRLFSLSRSLFFCERGPACIEQNLSVCSRNLSVVQL